MIQDKYQKLKRSRWEAVFGSRLHSQIQNYIENLAKNFAVLALQVQSCFIAAKCIDQSKTVTPLYSQTPTRYVRDHNENVTKLCVKV